MAVSNQSPSGFSYAQAAKGRTSTAPSQPPPTKANSANATPTAGTFSELGPNSNWADDVEATAEDKTDPHKASQELPKPTPVKDEVAERAISENKPGQGIAVVPKTDLVATPSTATNSEDSASAPQTNGSSETTWETKSDHSAHNLEPSWIAARKERQDGEKDSKGGERPVKKGKKGDKSAKETETPKPEPKPIVYMEAAPPQVNPWAKRAAPPPARSVAVPQAPKAIAKENQRPQVETRNKAHSIAGAQRETELGNGTKKPEGAEGTRIEHKNHARHGSKATTESIRAELTSAPAKLQREHQSLPNLATAPPPSVRDETSWPTPDKAEKSDDKERKDAAGEKGNEVNGDAPTEAGAKPREKTKWTQIPVTPTIVWATEEMNRPRGFGGERGGRGGATTRGRGGARGGPNGAKGDRAGPKKDGSPAEVEAVSTHPRGRSDLDRESMPPPAKPARKTTASGSRAGSHARGASQAKITGDNPTKDMTPAQLTHSPVHMDSRNGQDVKMFEPGSRPAAKDSGTTDVRESLDAPRETPVRKVPSDSKKDPRGFENYNGKEWTGSARGGKRTGRGRGGGGSREFPNGHPAGQTFVSGHGEGPGPFAAPHSPSTYQSPRGNSFGFAQPGRGSWRGASRSQSIPIDQIYGNRFNYGPQSGLPPVPPYYPGMYEYNGMPMTAMPYAPLADQQYIFEMVSTQLEYYFSIDNLLKDMFLRKNMDSQGFVFLDVIINFNRIKQLSADPNVLKAACLRSETIEIKTGEDGRDRLRRQEGWEQFVMPKEQREAAAQTDGPETLSRPEPPASAYPPSMDAFRSPAAVGPSGTQRRSYDVTHVMNGAVPGFAPFSPAHEAYGDLARGEEDRGRAAKSPIRENGLSPSHLSLNGIADAKDGEADVFPDEQAATLTVILKLGLQKPQHAAARTFSNGSIDTRSIFGELDKAGDDSPKPVVNGESATNGDHATPDISRHASPSHSRSPEKAASNELPLLWIKNSDRPHEALPQDTTLEPYIHLRLKALKQRDEASTGNCPYDLDVLYQFWSHFLIRNYNHRMYSEFKYYATDDVQKRNNSTGMQNLLQFYAKALASSTPIRDHIVRDYVELVKVEPAISHGQGFKQLRQAWRNGALNLKNRKKLNDIVDEELRSRLES